MPAYRPVALFCLLTLAAVPARAQGDLQPDALKTSVLQMLSLATFGMISIDDQQTTVTREGADYRMRLKLSGLSAPPDAAITAIARPLRNGRADIKSMTFPSTGTTETTSASGVRTRIDFTIGSQTTSGTVDPTLATESSYTADVGDVRLLTAQGQQFSEQTIDRMVAGGTFSAGHDGRLNVVTQSRATGWHLVGHGPDGFQTNINARVFAGHFSVDGLDRAQGVRLQTAIRRLLATAGTQARTQNQDPDPDPVTEASPEQKRQLAAVLAAATGLLNRFEGDETMEDVRIVVGPPAPGGTPTPGRGATATPGRDRSGIPGRGGAGTIGSLRLTLASDAAQGRLNTRMGIAVERIDVPALAVASAGLVPHHVELKTVLDGVAVAPLMALLRDATQEQIDPELLQARAITLLGDPAARFAIEALSFDAGPLSVTGSAKLLPRADGQFAGEIHIAARGVDALLAKAQSQPELQQALPMIVMAKGLGRAQGESLVWDIAVGDGPLTINGTPFRQPAGRTR